MLSHLGQEVRLASQIYNSRFILVEREHLSSLAKRGCRWRVGVSCERQNIPILYISDTLPSGSKAA